MGGASPNVPVSHTARRLLVIHRTANGEQRRLLLGVPWCGGLPSRTPSARAACICRQHGKCMSALRPTLRPRLAPSAHQHHCVATRLHRVTPCLDSRHVFIYGPPKDTDSSERSRQHRVIRIAKDQEGSDGSAVSAFGGTESDLTQKQSRRRVEREATERR
jgi:hypothetical protein